MRRDTEIGIIAGIVLAIIIGVFISTRPGVEEPKLPLLHSTTGVGKRVENESLEIDVTSEQPLHEIAGLPEEAPMKEVTDVSTGDTDQIDVDVDEEDELFEGDWDDEIIEGEWEEKFGEDESDDRVVEGEWGETVGEEVVKGDAAKAVKRPPVSAAGDAMQSPETIAAKLEKEAVYPKEDIIYEIRPNDTLAKLAKQFYGDAGEWIRIYNANTGKIAHRNALYIGQKIVIPAYQAAREGRGASLQVSSKSSQGIPASTTMGNRTHTVQKGDTLYKISRQYYNSDAGWKKIYEANRDVIPNKNSILQGTVLIIPE